MSGQLYITADVAKATGRSQNNINHYTLRANVGNICGKYRVFTEHEYDELCRLDRIAKEKKMDYGPLVVGCFSNRREAFPYATVEQVAANVGTTKTAINKWIGKGMLDAIAVGPQSSRVFLLDKENHAKAKRLAEESRAIIQEKPFSMSPSCTPGWAHISIDPSMLKFSITREGAKKLMEYLKQQIGEA